jgi:NADH-quinone oxidoreductase subunit L
MFHLLAHAGFKALLFLASGVVLHSAGTVSMARLGGLRGRLPRTALLMALGLAALSGLPPLAGFFSKESIVTAAEHAAAGDVAGVSPVIGWAVLVVGLLSVVVTAAYCTRLWLRTFAGDPRDAEAYEHAHEPGPWMSVPLWVLAVPTVFFGGLALLGAGVGVWTGTGDERLTPALATSVVSLVALAVGFLVVLLVFRRAPAADPAVAVARGAYPVMADGFGVDRFYDDVVVRPTRRLANLTQGLDLELTGATDGTGARTSRLGAALRRGQDGNPQRYLTYGLGGFAVAAVVVMAALAAVTGGGA